MSAPLTAAGFAARTGVSRETIARLEAYERLLRHWQRRINLVGRSSLDDFWRRHVLDSAQLIPLIPRDTGSVLDIGSGAGLPGLVLAILGVAELTLVESDSRKCAFLRQAARQTGAAVTIAEGRIEALGLAPAAMVTARACAPLDRLLGYCAPALAAGGRALLFKGQNAEKELTEAAKGWKMRVERHPSQTDSNGVILEISDIARVERS